MKRFVFLSFILIYNIGIGQLISSCDSVLRYRYLRYRYSIYLDKSVNDVYANLGASSATIERFMLASRSKYYERITFFCGDEDCTFMISFYIPSEDECKSVQEFFYSHKDSEVEFIQILVTLIFDEERERFIDMGCLLYLPEEWGFP